MPCQSRDLSVLAYANGFTLWHYSSTDPASDVLAAGYFDEAASLLRTGDLVAMNTAVHDTSEAENGSPETRLSGVVRVANGTVTMGQEPNQAAFVEEPSGGAVIDTECRAQVAALTAALIASGQMSAS